MSREAVVAVCIMCRQRVSVIDGCFITHGDSHGDITCSASGYPATARELAKGQK